MESEWGREIQKAEIQSLDVCFGKHMCILDLEHHFIASR